MDNTGVNAHISVLFTKIPEEFGAGTPEGTAEKPPEGSGKEAMEKPPGSSGKDSAGKETLEELPPNEPDNLGKETVQGTSPKLGPAPPGMDEDKWKAMWEGVPEGRGWCYVVEDPSLCEDQDTEPRLHTVPPLSTRNQD